MTRFVTLLACLLLLSCLRPAGAEQPVEVVSGSLGLGGYARAARALEVRDWGSQSASEDTTHLILQVNRPGAVLAAYVPPDTDEASARRWLQHAAQSLGWSQPRLSLSRLSGALALKLEGKGAAGTVSATSNRLSVDLPSLVTGLRRLSGNPVWICVRFPGATIASRQPAPVAEGRVAGDQFLFYSTPAGITQPLVVEYGIPERWPVAAAVALGLWLLAPFAAATAARRYLVQHGSLPPERKISLYDRWMMWGRVAATLGLVVTLASLDPGHLRYYGLGSALGVSTSVVILAPYWFWCDAASGIARRRLVREMAPESFMISGHPALNLGLMALLLLFFLPSGALSGITGSASPMRSMGSLLGIFLAGGGLLMLAIFVPIFLRRPPVPDREAPPVPPEDPEGLRAALRDYTDRIVREREANAGRPEHAAMLEKAAAYTGFFRAAMHLAPDQQAAVSVAMRMANPHAMNVVRWQMGGFCGLSALMVVLGAWQWRTAGPGWGGLLPTALCTGAWILGSSLLSVSLRGGKERQLKVDLLVAQAMDDPRRYLDALQLLAEAERLTQMMVVGKSSAGMDYTRRFHHLEQHLRLD